MDPACDRPMETIKVNDTQLRAIWWAASETALIVPIIMPETAKAHTSTPSCILLGIPIRNNSRMVSRLYFHCLSRTAINRLNVRCFKTIRPSTTKINVRVIRVAYPAPTSSRRGKPQCPYMKSQFRKILTGMAAMESIMAVFVYSRPSVNCLRVMKSNMGMIESPTRIMNGRASSTTCGSWSRCLNIFLPNTRPAAMSRANTIHKRKPL